MTPRGIRNCNPLNIRRSKDQWKGMEEVQTDRAFVQFKAMEWGYRAAFLLLRTYRVKYKRYSVRTIIERWAPENENHTQAYIDRVCKEMGVPPHFILNIGSLDEEDTYWACELARAMVLVENGNKYAHLIKREDIRKGYALAFEPPDH